MRMVTDAEEEIIEPSADEIKDTLESLEERDGRFARLEATETVFIQTGRHGKDDYALEYSDGERVEQARGRLSWEEVVGAFQAFSRDEMAWRKQYKWADIESLGGLPNWWWPALAAIFILIAFILFN